MAQGDTISQAEKAEKDRPGIAETKAIAEEGFIYGLPIVMNYAVMNEYAVDSNSGQFKAPFNQINNEARVFTYKDTAIVTPNSDTPYSIRLAGSARRADGALGPGGGERRATTRCSSDDGNTYNYGYIGSRATGKRPATTWWPVPTGRARRRRASRRCSVPDAVLAGGLSHAALQSARHAERGEGPGGLQGAAALGILEAAGAAGGAGRSIFRRSTRR